MFKAIMNWVVYYYPVIMTYVIVIGGIGLYLWIAAKEDAEAEACRRRSKEW